MRKDTFTTTTIISTTCVCVCVCVCIGSFSSEIVQLILLLLLLVCVCVCVCVCCLTYGRRETACIRNIWLREMCSRRRMAMRSAAELEGVHANTLL